jgi:REP element-mobilizing transposase RayT
MTQRADGMTESDLVPGRIGFDPQFSPERAAHRLYVHVVWATRGRARLDSSAMRGAVEGHLIGLCRRLDIEPLAVTALADRVHVLLRFKPTQSLAALVRRLKDGLGGVPVNEGTTVHWALGYAAITIGSRDVRRVMRFLARLGDECDAAPEPDQPGASETVLGRRRRLTFRARHR